MKKNLFFLLLAFATVNTAYSMRPLSPAYSENQKKHQALLQLQAMKAAAQVLLKCGFSSENSFLNVSEIDLIIERLQSELAKDAPQAVPVERAASPFAPVPVKPVPSARVPSSKQAQSPTIFPGYISYSY